MYFHVAKLHLFRQMNKGGIIRNKCIILIDYLITICTLLYNKFTSKYNYFTLFGEC